MRKIYLDELPHKIYKNRNVLDWNNCIGEQCSFIYEDIESKVEVQRYDVKKQKVTIKIDGYCDNYTMYTADFIKCSFGKALGKVTDVFKYEIGTVFNDRDGKRNLVIIDREYRFKKELKSNKNKYPKYYRFKCNKCGWEDGWIIESGLNSGEGCPVCCVPTRKIIKGINDLATTAPWMVKYFQEQDRHLIYTTAKGSNKIKIYPICPDCGEVSKRKYNLDYLNCRGGFSCPVCSDGLSYPNKFMYNVINQLNVDFKNEIVFDWSKNKKYDLYIPSLDVIVENHGEQHYIEGSKFKLTLKEQQENDTLKEYLAKKNNIQHYITLDCRESELEWIKNSVMSSELPILLGFKEEDVDWLKCHKYALSSLVKKACDYKVANPDLSPREIGLVFNVHGSTIANYLKRGTKLGWCEYDPKEEQRKNARKIIKARYSKLNGL